MARAKEEIRKRPIEHYTHDDKTRLNNPPVGLVTPETDKDAAGTRYVYDPHLDPQLIWAGKAERTSFEVPTVSLHVHERIDPRTIMDAVKRRNGSEPQLSLFDAARSVPLRQEIEFYKHKHGWSNRLVAGDSLLVMNSLLEKEGMGGQVQMVYIDPPYGIRYGSNFQPFTNQREVKDRKDDDLTSEPEMIRAFRDTWELGIHSYLTYLRDRLLLTRELLTDSGSCFIQISDENVHRVRALCDEIFGSGNFVSLIVVQKTGGLGGASIKSVADYLVWYAKERKYLKYNKLFSLKSVGIGEGTGARYDQLEAPDGQTRRAMTAEERANPKAIPEGWRPYQLDNLTSGAFRENTTVPFEFEGETFHPGPNACWKTTVDGLRRLVEKRRIVKAGKTLRYVRYLDDFPAYEITNVWDDVAGASNKIYVVQTSTSVAERCILMTTDPGDIVFDMTCGSGTTAYSAEQWGRRWIACDTSRVALALAKQRLMTAVFEYYQLAHPQEGVGSGFKYEAVPHVTLKSVATNEPPTAETLYDKPLKDTKRARVSGPFTVEAVPAPAVKPLDELEDGETQPADEAIARTGETARQGDWRDELLKTGIRGKGGQRISFSRVEPLPGTRALQAEAETKEDDPKRVVIAFGPENAPLEQRQVELAIEEAQTLVPKPKIVVFAAFQFDAEAAKDIDELNWPGVTLLKAQMNADLLTEDLKKKRASNESFWLVGQPDVETPRIAKGADAGKYQVTVNGFDYYNTKTGTVEGGGSDKIAMWLLDTDYDGRSLFPQQVFLPMAGKDEGWSKLAKNLKAEIDPELIEAYHSTMSLPFAAGRHKRIAVKIVDDRGIESLKVIKLD